jgi:hypothetical protein
MNNYFVKTINKTLFDIYNIVIQDFVTDEEHVDINLILSVGYIKNTFSFLLKHVVYCSCIGRFEIYKNRTDFMTEVLTLDDLFIELEKIEMYKIIKLLKLFEMKVISILTQKKFILSL